MGLQLDMNKLVIVHYLMPDLIRSYKTYPCSFDPTNNYSLEMVMENMETIEMNRVTLISWDILLLGEHLFFMPVDWK